MSTIAEIVVPADEFALQRTLDRNPTIAVEVERVVAYDPEVVMPYVWVAGDEAAVSTLDDEFEADPTVETVELLTDHGNERLYRVAWVENVSLVLHVLTEERATVLTATGEHAQWNLRLLFPERDALSRTYEYATEEGLTLSVRKVHELEGNRRGRYGLTEPQHETLVMALQHGYYEIPRDIDMDELSTQLGISHQALSERLRRAHRALVEEAISLDSDGKLDDSA